MEKKEHGAKLKTALAARGWERKDLVAAVNVSLRTVTNWTTGANLPNDNDRQVLRKLFPGYDDPGDAVEVAIMSSHLTEDRKYALIGNYKRLLREQAEGSRAVG